MRILFFGISCAEADAESGFTSLLVQTKAGGILIDCSGNPVQALLRAGIDPLTLETLILTHAHVDHIYGYPALLHTLHCMKRTSELLVVCHPDTRLRAEALTAAVGLATDPDLAGHSSALQAGENAAASSVESLFLCHLCGRLYDGLDPAAEAARTFTGLIVVPEPFRWYDL